MFEFWQVESCRTGLAASKIIDKVPKMKCLMTNLSELNPAMLFARGSLLGGLKLLATTKGLSKRQVTTRMPQNLFLTQPFVMFSQAGKYANVNSSLLFKFLIHVRHVCFCLMGLGATLALRNISGQPAGFRV